jgi:hypothetical protein
MVIEAQGLDSRINRLIGIVIDKDIFKTIIKNLMIS